jgi:hypothetical protein
MVQMEDSTSDTTREEVDTQTYSISSGDMCHLKNKIAALETAISNTPTSVYYIPTSNIVQTVSDIKNSVDQIKPDPVVL